MNSWLIFGLVIAGLLILLFWAEVFAFVFAVIKSPETFIQWRINAKEKIVQAKIDAVQAAAHAEVERISKAKALALLKKLPRTQFDELSAEGLELVIDHVKDLYQEKKPLKLKMDSRSANYKESVAFFIKSNKYFNLSMQRKDGEDKFLIISVEGFLENWKQKCETANKETAELKIIFQKKAANELQDKQIAAAMKEKNAKDALLNEISA
jgi:hypothetical protein